MDMRSWKKVLLQWITECGFMERNYFNIEQSDIDVFYQNYILKHQKTDSVKYKRLGNFLKDFYPNFDINLDDENCISSADYIYVYSLLLHYCCVKCPETLFHEICQKLQDYAQQCIASFFKELLDIEQITREDLRHAIAEVANTQSPPPRLNDSFSSVMSASGSAGGQTTTSFSRCDSPLKTPKRCAGPHRVSPSTPKSNLLEERTREVYHLRAQLETECYEKGLLEVQIKQNEDKIHKLSYDHKRLLQQIQDLKNDIIVISSDGSSNRDGEENQVQKRLLKELYQREQEIIKLSDIAMTLREEKTLMEEKLIYAEKKIVICMNRIKELDVKVDELKEELEKKNDTIFYLTSSKLELEQFISETRTSSSDPLNTDLNSSTDCLDNSYIRGVGNNTTNSSNSLNSPENLAASVIDVQLKEKEHENQILKAELQNVKQEHKRLAKELNKIIHDFATPSGDSEDSWDSELQRENCDERQTNEEDKILSCEEQFYVFNNCMEKINKYHKTEKSKVKQLEELTKSLQEQNEELQRNLEMISKQVMDLKDKQLIKEQQLEELTNAKQEIEANLEQKEKDFQQLQIEKQTLYNNLQTSENLKESLNQLLKELNTKLEMQQQNNKELTTQNMDLKLEKTTSQTELKDLQQHLTTKTLEFEKEIEKLTNKVAIQIEEIYAYQQMEKTLKNNYEQIMIENDLLKKEARETDTHLSNMREELKDKDIQMIALAEQINNINQKNKKLEENINQILEKYEQEKQIKNDLKTNQDKIILELEKSINKLKDDLKKTEQLLENKQHECEEIIKELATMRPQIEDTLKLFNVNEINDDSLNRLLKVKTQITKLLKENKETNVKLEDLITTQLQSTNRIEELQMELKQKNDSIEDLNKINSQYKENMEKLKEEQLNFITKIQQDLEKKELELQERLKEAASEYDNSLERIGQELKIEKEQHSNKEIELLLLKAEYNDFKKQLNEKSEQMEKLQEECKKLQKYENKVLEVLEENDKLRYEIESFKQEVTQNALRLLEADKALNEFIDLTKEQDNHKIEMEKLEISLQDKDKIILLLQQQQQEQNKIKTKEIEQLQQDIEKKTENIIILQENLHKITTEKEKILKTLEEKTQQIDKEHQDKIVLLNSLEKTSDQLKISQEDNIKQKLSLEENLKDLKEQFNILSLKNTKLQGDLLEREAELNQSQEEQQQEKDKFQQKLTELRKNLEKKTEHLKSLEIDLMEIIAIMENNFNLSMELENKDVSNIFKTKNLDEPNSHKEYLEKLRNNLNILLYSQKKLQQELQNISLENQEVSLSFQTFKKSNNDLQLKLKQQEKILNELREQLNNEEENMQKRISREVKRLEEDLLNLEKVNEHLTQENVKIHITLDEVKQNLKESKIIINKLEEEKKQLQEEILAKTLALEKLQQEEKKLQHSLKEKCLNNEKVLEKSKYYENLLKEKSTKLQNHEKLYNEQKEKLQKSQQKVLNYQTQHQSQQMELKKLQEKLKQLQLSNESLDLELIQKNKDLLILNNKQTDSIQKLKAKEEELQMTLDKLDEMVTLKLNFESQCAQLFSQNQQLQRDLDFIKTQQQIQQDENTRLNNEIDSIKQDKQQLKDEIKETKISLQMANDNVSQLIQQISSIRLEKESILDENQLLKKQLEETNKHQTSSESKLKTIIEKSQDSERKLLSNENELKCLKIKLEKNETTSLKLLTENKKLKEAQDLSTKRIEKLALKLGDSQARSAKLERDNEKLAKTLEANSATVEALQKEKDLLQTEAKSLKESLSRAERGHEQLANKVHNLENSNANLNKIKQKLEASDLDGKTKLNKLEKMREANEEKLRKLSASLSNAEHDNVKLNLEIGALNSQLQEIKSENNQENHQNEIELKQQLIEAQNETQKYEGLNEKLKLEIQQLKEENSNLNDHLSKITLTLNINKEKCEKMSLEMEQLRSDMLIIRQEKLQIDLIHQQTIEKLEDLESLNTKLLNERKNLENELEKRISSLESKLANKTKEVDDLQNEIVLLKTNSENHSSLIQQTHTASLSQLQQLQSKLLFNEETMQKEQQLIAQLRLDNQILHSKYQDAKQRALDAATSSEERIKENRLELEGKLEKMKNKMKTLYTEEINKMKTKQEREVALIKSELEVQKTQNAKYEEHTRKLSNQIVRLNDNILEHQKENTMLSTKLKHIMEQQQHHESERFKRPSSIHVSTISSSTAPAAAANNIGTNLAMEDEEGEVFNTTYLTDLKNGRMSELMSRDICVEELKYRNSLLPPHLRSTYSAQYDHEFPEDELKDGPHSLDDSMSALLSTTAGGTRKKCTGVTHYKRPGPPTPSKNGGRLSFGGSSEPCREILKESYDTNAGSSAVSSSKTPARFNFFASRFSMGNTRDEKPIIKQEPEMTAQIKQEPEMKPQIKQESAELNLRKAVHKKNIKGNGRLLTTVGFTSTPRKSKVHYDQRRLLDQLMTSSPSPSPLSIEHKNIQIENKLTPPDVSLIETPLTIFDRRDLIKAAPPIHHKSNAKRMVAIASGLRRNRRNSSMFGRRLSRRMNEICTPTSGETTSSALSTPVVEKVNRQTFTTATTTSGGAGKTAVLQKCLRKRSKRVRGTRPSLYLRGNIFAKYRTPNKGALPALIRYKSKKQRFDRFNKARDINSFKNEYQKEVVDETMCINKAFKDRTYDLKNNNYATFNHNLLGETLILNKCQNKTKKMEETFTFGEEVFEMHDTEDLDYMEDYESDEYYDEEEDSNDIDYGDDNDMKYDFPFKKEDSYKQELITSQDLEEFDRFVAAKSKIKPEREEINEASFRCNGSSQHFEKLLIETESNAPFEVKHIQFNVTKSSRSQSSSLNHSHSQHSTTPDRDHVNISTATPHNSPSNPMAGQLSRTIYGGTVIYNHRLPNINTTFVRKSSIYVKNRNKSYATSHRHINSSRPIIHDDDDDDVVLITNQTITFVDIMRMWSQMDSSTRIIVSFAILASFTTLLGLFVSFCHKR